MRAAGLIAAAILALAANGIPYTKLPNVPEPRRRRPTDYRAKPDPSDVFATERSAHNAAVDERKAAKRAAKLAKKGGV